MWNKDMMIQGIMQESMKERKERIWVDNNYFYLKQILLKINFTLNQILSKFYSK